METLANWLIPDVPKPLDIKQLTFGRPGGNKGFTFSTIPLPLKTNEVLIEVKAASLNPWDLKVWKQPQTWLKEEHGLGQDFSGIISDLGQGAASKGWKVGDRVCGLKLHYGSQGTIASHIVIDLNKTKYSMTHIPDNMTSRKPQRSLWCLEPPGKACHTAQCRLFEISLSTCVF